MPDAAPRRASIHTLGCRLNQGETRLIEEQLRAAGYVLAPFGEPADLGVIHTCVVTCEAEAKSRKYIRRFRRINPTAVLAVIGCYAQTAGAELAKWDGVDLILGNEDKLKICEHLSRLEAGQPVLARDRPGRSAFTVPFQEQGPPITRRVNLKIQDGCDLMCSYCYIPFARGRSRSRSFDDALAEARSLTARGAKEIVLTGVNLGDYSDNGKGLPHLADALSALEPQPRIRISSIELTNFPEELFPRMADPSHGLVPHLHVPLQSGSDTILRAMRRPYSSAEYLDLLHRAVAAVPGIGLGADVMVGFPGETETDFQATADLIRESPLGYLHVFQYSERRQVASARIQDKVSVAAAKVRSETLRRLAQEKKRRFQEQWVGHTVRVLFESRQEACWVGHAANYMEVVVESEAPLQNQFARVHVVKVQEELLRGRLV